MAERRWMEAALTAIQAHGALDDNAASMVWTAWVGLNPDAIESVPDRLRDVVAARFADCDPAPTIDPEDVTRVHKLREVADHLDLLAGEASIGRPKTAEDYERLRDWLLGHALAIRVATTTLAHSSTPSTRREAPMTDWTLEQMREELWSIYCATGEDPDGADARHLNPGEALRAVEELRQDYCDVGEDEYEQRARADALQARIDALQSRIVGPGPMRRSIVADNTPWQWTPPSDWDGTIPPPYVGCSWPYACQHGADGPLYCENPAVCDFGAHPAVPTRKPAPTDEEVGSDGE